MRHSTWRTLNPMTAARLILALLILVAQPLLAELEDGVGGTSSYAYGDATALERLLARLQEDLGLSIEQQAVLADILKDYGPRLKTITRQGIAVAWSLMDVAPKNPQYSSDTEAAAQAAAEAAAEWVRTVTEMRNAIYSILSPDQITLIESRLAERRQAWQERHADPAPEALATD